MFLYGFYYGIIMNLGKLDNSNYTPTSSNGKKYML